MRFIIFSLAGSVVVGFLVINPSFLHQHSSYWPHSQLNDWRENSLHIALITVGNLHMRQYPGKFVLNFKEGLVASWRKTLYEERAISLLKWEGG